MDRRPQRRSEFQPRLCNRHSRTGSRSQLNPRRTTGRSGSVSGLLVLSMARSSAFIFDIHLGRHIAFTPQAVYSKVVEHHRGGFCYELNTLFHHVLRELGFEVKFHAATMFRDGQPGTPMGHMVLSVRLGGTLWLVDVGNGKFVREPLNFDGSHGSPGRRDAISH